MAFQLKDFASITASMLNWMKAVQQKVTDFNVGSILRTMLEAIATEIDEFYKQAFIGLKEAIPVSVYTSFSFPALDAISASGLIQLTITAQGTNTLVPAGTVWVPASGSGTNYEQTANVLILAAATSANIPVSAVTPGSLGNLPSGTSFTPSPVPPGFVSATNSASWINGTDAESAADHKTRFNAYISTLPRGTAAAILYGLKTAYLVDGGGNIVERVVSANVVEPWRTDPSQPVSLVNAWVHNGVGGTSSPLVTQAQAVVYGYYDVSGNPVPGWKAAGVKVVVAAATEVPLNVVGVLTALPGFDKPTLIALATPAVSTYLQQLPIASSALFAELIELVMSIPGVFNFVLSAPTTDVVAAISQKITVGTVTIT